MGSSWSSAGNTLPEVLRTQSSAHTGRRLYTLLSDSGREEGSTTFDELELRSRRIAAVLQAVARRGERAVLLYPPGLEYIAGLLGAMQAGLIAVPAYPPDPTRLERTLPRLRAIIQDAQAQVVLTTSMILGLSDALAQRAPDLKALHWVATDAARAGAE